MDPVKTVETTVRMYAGKEYPVTITRVVGLAKYQRGAEIILADAATFVDYGPKLGVTSNYTLHKDVEPTEAERAEGRRHIQEVTARALIEQGIW